MARRLCRPSPVPVTRLLLLAGLAAIAVAVAIAIAAPAAKDPEDGQIRISVLYPTEEESQWLDRWAEKYRSKKPGSDFSIQPATDEQSAYLNRIFSGSKNSGYEGRIEFDGDDRPLVVDKFHSGARSSEPSDDLKNKEGESHAEHDVMEL